MAGGMGGSKESAPGKNPFELLKEAIKNNNSTGGDYNTNKPKETVQIKETTKLIFSSDIEGAEKIYEDPKLEKLDEYGDKKLYHSKDIEFVAASNIKSYIAHNSPDSKISHIEKLCSKIEKLCSKSGYAETPLREETICVNNSWAPGDKRRCSSYETGGGYDPGDKKKCASPSTGGGYDPDAEVNIEKALEQPSQTAEGYKTNTNYRFITKLDKNIIFAKDSEQLDHKIYPKLNGIGELTINLDASHSAKKYFETPMYVTFSASANDSCVTRSIDNYWYDPNELKLIKEQPESKIQNTEENILASVDVIAITFDGVSDSYYDGYNLHERMIASSLNNSEIKVFCSSCIEQKDYSVKVDIDSYKKKHAENVKKQEKIQFDQSVAPFKSQCEEIGFKPGTDKFKNCLVEMMN